MHHARRCARAHTHDRSSARIEARQPSCLSSLSTSRRGHRYDQPTHRVVLPRLARRRRARAPPQCARAEAERGLAWLGGHWQRWTVRLFFLSLFSSGGSELKTCRIQVLFIAPTHPRHRPRLLSLEIMTDSDGFALMRLVAASCPPKSMALARPPHYPLAALHEGVRVQSCWNGIAMLGPCHST